MALLFARGGTLDEGAAVGVEQHDHVRRHGHGARGTWRTARREAEAARRHDRCHPAEAVTLRNGVSVIDLRQYDLSNRCARELLRDPVNRADAIDPCTAIGSA